MASRRNADIPVIGPFLKVIFGTRNERFVKRYMQHVHAIGAMEPQMRALTDAELRAKTEDLRRRVDAGARTLDLLDETFAVAREAMDRAVGIRAIFNPIHASRFDPSRLPADARRMYDEVKARIATMEPVTPEGDLLGNTRMIEGWEVVDIPPALYDAVRALYPESKPPFRSRPFDVQLIGAMVLSQGKISEMKTGEGKTIVAPLAAYLACIERKRVHVVTVNDYLVQRDRDWTFPFFRAVGLTVGAIHPQHMQDEAEKARMYKCDVVYGTTSEFGFDYLRDNMKRSVDQQVQRKREFAIVDEVDSTLIDEARTPLIISGPAHDDQPRYELADRLARHLVEKNRPWAQADEKVEACKRRIKGIEGDIRNARDRAAIPEMQKQLKIAQSELPGLEKARDKFTQYYEIELERKQAHLTHHGIAEAQRIADLGSFYVGDNIDLPHLLENSLRAHVVYQRDRDYVVMDVPDRFTGQTTASVVIVDVFTGRPMIGRQWSDGLHQAVEAKEAVPVKQETQTVATITIQNFFKMYTRLAGMTGTADTEAQEFHDIYGLDVVSIPTNLPVIRRDFQDVVYLTARDKWDAIVDEIKNFHDIGRPVLVGTTSVEKSEMLAQMLAKKHGVKHEVLNAKQHEREANIVEDAGQLGAVMIATNMAGRGTDIKLGRITRAQLLEHWQRRNLAPRELTVDSTDEQVRELCYRKIAPREIEIGKDEAKAMPFDELELRLLRHWASKYTWMQPGSVEKASADDLRAALDEQGRFSLHRLSWVDSIEGLGGLHVIGTERHESRRIDNQLRGRSGRQGDRGSTRFFVSLEDDLMKMFAGETTMKALSRLGMREGDAIEHPWLTKSIERAQRKVEERNFQIRKNILEYDEVMEHQRQSFYGTRQRVLEGREVKGLVFEYIEDAVRDSVSTYLAPGYAGECAAEYARRQLNCSIPPERLRGREADEMDARIRRIAKDEFRAMIAVTLGEYLNPGAGENAQEKADDGAAGDPSDANADLKGLAAWAQREFRVELKPSELRTMSAHQIEEMLIEASERHADAADLSGISDYTGEDYGPRELCRWMHSVFEITVDPDEIWGTPEKLERAPDTLLSKARDAYAKREIEYPVEFIMDMTTGMIRYNPEQALSGLVRWANQRYGLNWDEAKVRSTMPPKIREELLAVSRDFVSTGKMDREIDALLGEGDPDLVEQRLQTRFGAKMPAWIRDLEGEHQRHALRGAVEMAIRGELAQFERLILVETVDSAWKDHLYAMDQLRDSVGFRAFSQQDPRIEYKREGSRLFQEMSRTVRDRVCEQVFKLKISPSAAIQQQMAMLAMQQRAAASQGQGQPGVATAAVSAGAPPQSPRPAGAMNFGSGTFSGPGFGAPPSGARAAQPPAPPSPQAPPASEGPSGGTT
ncbi:MAG: preprotein translocase subunit SecA [Phycisphaeraceae bacterium]|nr:preprotein translocase subunit SecA [Phycisphaeraceae bacterium]